MKGHITTPDGVRLFFHQLGNGPNWPNATIIPNALHMFDSFRHLANNRTVIFFDLRNRGNSDSVGDAKSWHAASIMMSTISRPTANILESTRWI